MNVSAVVSITPLEPAFAASSHSCKSFPLLPSPTCRQLASTVKPPPISLPNVSRSLDVHCQHHLLSYFRMCLLWPRSNATTQPGISLHSASDHVTPCANLLSAKPQCPQDKAQTPCLGLQGHDLPTYFSSIIFPPLSGLLQATAALRAFQFHEGT